MEIPFSIAILKAYHAHNNLMRPKIAAIGLSVGQPKIMGFLALHDGCMQKDLAALCDIEPATISRILDRMESEHLITRSAVADNKRAAAISLTPLGHRRQKKVAEIRTQVENDELAGFSDAERDQFYQYLTRLYENITRETGGEACK